MRRFGQWVPTLENDRLFAPNIAAATRLVTEGRMLVTSIV